MSSHPETRLHLNALLRQSVSAHLGTTRFEPGTSVPGSEDVLEAVWSRAGVKVDRAYELFRSKGGFRQEPRASSFRARTLEKTLDGVVRAQVEAWGGFGSFDGGNSLRRPELEQVDAMVRGNAMLAGWFHVEAAPSPVFDVTFLGPNTWDAHFFKLFPRAAQGDEAGFLWLAHPGMFFMAREGGLCSALGDYRSFGGDPENFLKLGRENTSRWLSEHALAPPPYVFEVAPAYVSFKRESVSPPSDLSGGVVWRDTEGESIGFDHLAADFRDAQTEDARTPNLTSPGDTLHTPPPRPPPLSNDRIRADVLPSASVLPQKRVPEPPTAREVRRRNAQERAWDDAAAEMVDVVGARSSAGDLAPHCRRPLDVEMLRQTVDNLEGLRLWVSSRIRHADGRVLATAQTAANHVIDVLRPLVETRASPALTTPLLQAALIFLTRRLDPETFDMAEALLSDFTALRRATIARHLEAGTVDELDAVSREEVSLRGTPPLPRSGGARQTFHGPLLRLALVNFGSLLAWLSGRTWTDDHAVAERVMNLLRAGFHDGEGGVSWHQHLDVMLAGEEAGEYHEANVLALEFMEFMTVQSDMMETPELLESQVLEICPLLRACLGIPDATQQEIQETTLRLALYVMAQTQSEEVLRDREAQRRRGGLGEDTALQTRCLRAAGFVAGYDVDGDFSGTLDASGVRLRRLLSPRYQDLSVRPVLDVIFAAMDLARVLQRQYNFIELSQAAPRLRLPTLSRARSILSAAFGALQDRELSRTREARRAAGGDAASLSPHHRCGKLWESRLEAALRYLVVRFKQLAWEEEQRSRGTAAADDEETDTASSGSEEAVSPRSTPPATPTPPPPPPPPTPHLSPPATPSASEPATQDAPQVLVFRSNLCPGNLEARLDAWSLTADGVHARTLTQVTQRVSDARPRDPSAAQRAAESAAEEVAKMFAFAMGQHR